MRPIAWARGLPQRLIFFPPPAKVPPAPLHGSVIREGLRLLKEREDLRVLRLEELRREVQKGLDSLARGEGTPLDIEHIKAEGRKRVASRRNNGDIENLL